MFVFNYKQKQVKKSNIAKPKPVYVCSFEFSFKTILFSCITSNFCFTVIYFMFIYNYKQKPVKNLKYQQIKISYVII